MVNPGSRRSRGSRRRNPQLPATVGKIGKMEIPGIPGVPVQETVAGMFGAVAVMTIPKMTRWNYGWAGVLTSAVTTIGVGFAAKRLTDSRTAHAAMLGGMIITGLRALKALNFFGTGKFGLSGVGNVEESEYVEDDTLVLGEMEEEEIYGVGSTTDVKIV